MLVHYFIEPAASRRQQVIRGLVMLALCGLLACVAACEAWRQLRVERWAPAPCKVVAARVEQRRDMAHESTPYVFEVTYEYRWGDRTYRGDQYRADYGGSEAAAEAYALADAFPVGLDTACRVNPTRPAESVLRESPHGDLAALTCLLGGLSLLMTVFYALPQLSNRTPAQIFRPRRSRPAAPSLSPTRAKPRPRRRANGELVAAGALCAMLLAAGGWWGVRPLLRCRQASAWPPVPCHVISSVVARSEVHGEAPVTLYRADILYRYTVGGREYASNAYSVSDTSAPFYATGKHAITRKYPPGSQSTCHVNPANPAEAVLETLPQPAAVLGLTPGALGTLLAAWIIGEARGSQRVWRACLVLTAAVGSVVAGCLFVLVAVDVARAWRAGQVELWGTVVAVFLLAMTGWAGKGFARARRGYLGAVQNALAPRPALPEQNANIRVARSTPRAVSSRSMRSLTIE